MLNSTQVPMRTREGNVVYINPLRDREDCVAVGRANAVLKDGISKFVENQPSGQAKEYFMELLERAREIEHRS